MFDFHKLEVYRKARLVNSTIDPIIVRIKDLDKRRQFVRASLSIQLNLAEGTGRFTKRDKRNFYIISRASVFECVAILDILVDTALISPDEYEGLYESYEELSKMLFSMIQKLSN